ncbi:MAG: molybdopterin synthase sulfur carrier subunit [Cyanobacteriota bacterium]
MAIAYTRQQVSKYIKATINIPYHLRNITNNQKQVVVLIDKLQPDIKEILNSFFEKYPGIKTSIIDEAGNINKFLSVYLNDKNINRLNSLETKLNEDNIVLSFRPSLAGG